MTRFLSRQKSLQYRKPSPRRQRGSSNQKVREKQELTKTVKILITFCLSNLGKCLRVNEEDCVDDGIFFF